MQCSIRDIVVTELSCSESIAGEDVGTLDESLSTAEGIVGEEYRNLSKLTLF